MTHRWSIAAATLATCALSCACEAPPAATPPQRPASPQRPATQEGSASTAGRPKAAAANEAVPTLRLRHERLPAAQGLIRRTDQVVAGEDGQPAAVWGSHGEIAAPQPAQPGDDTPLYAAKPPPPVGPDRRRGQEGDLHYQMVFNPEVAPFKREVAYDTVREDLTMTISGQGRRRVELAPSNPPGHELFWGHLRMEFEPGKPVGLPSVAPDSQVLMLRVDPPLPVQLQRDDAGNFSAVSSAAGTVDMRYLMSAPADYFGAPLGRGAVLGGPPAPQLPLNVKAAAMRLWPKLQLSRTADHSQLLTLLVRWFRGFVPGDAPPTRNGPLADLVLGMRGVCRHRTLGFVVMAQSLGIPAHFVANDAHSFAEVWAPHPDGSAGWLRIDLGGASDSLQLHAARGKQLHQPQFPDPFAQPAKGATDEASQRADRWAGATTLRGAEGLRNGPVAGPAGIGGGQGGGRDQGGPAALAAQQWLAGRVRGTVQPERGGSADPRRPTSVSMVSPPDRAWVGEPLRIAGHLDGGSGQLVPIELWLVDAQDPLRGLQLGVTMTQPNGDFVAEVAIPADAVPKDYDLVARFAGDINRAPSDSGP